MALGLVREYRGGSEFEVVRTVLNYLNSIELPLCRIYSADMRRYIKCCVHNY